MEDVRGRVAFQQGIDELRPGVDRRRVVLILDLLGLVLGCLEAFQARGVVDAPHDRDRRRVQLPRRVCRRGIRLECPSPDVRLGTEIRRGLLVEWLVDPRELPRDERLFGQEEDVHRTRGYGGVRGHDRGPDRARHLVADRLADSLEQLGHASVVRLHEQLADDRGRELFRIVADVALGRPIVRQRHAREVRFDAPLEGARLEAALDRDRDVGRWLAGRRGDVCAGRGGRGCRDFDSSRVARHDDLACGGAEGLAFDREHRRDASNRLRLGQGTGGEMDGDRREQVIDRDEEAVPPALVRREIKAVGEELDVEVVGLGVWSRHFEGWPGDAGRRRWRQADLQLERAADEHGLVGLEQPVGAVGPRLGRWFGGAVGGLGARRRFGAGGRLGRGRWEVHPARRPSALVGRLGHRPAVVPLQSGGRRRIGVAKEA